MMFPLSSNLFVEKLSCEGSGHDQEPTTEEVLNALNQMIKEFIERA